MPEYERDKINDFFRALAISMIYFFAAIAILFIVYRHLPERFVQIKYIKLSFYILFGVVVLSALNKFNNLKINYNIDSDRYYIQYNAPNYVETLKKNIIVYKSFKEEAEKNLRF